MKVLITVKGDQVAPRFDLTTEVLIAEANEGISSKGPRNVLMPGPSGDELCSLIIREQAGVVVCGGIEDSFYQYLEWKKVKIIERVIGQADVALKMALNGKLLPGTVIYNSPSAKQKGRE